LQANVSILLQGRVAPYPPIGAAPQTPLSRISPAIRGFGAQPQWEGKGQHAPAPSSPTIRAVRGTPIIGDIGGVLPKKIFNKTVASAQTTSEQPANKDGFNPEIVKECISIITSCDPDKKCTKDELISRVSYQRNLLLKASNGEMTPKILAMGKILSDLNEQWKAKHLTNMNDVRDKQDKMMVKIEQNVFKQKIDLTGEKKPGDEDESLVIFKNSKKYWEKNKGLNKPPPEKEKIFKKTKGNLKMPPDLQKLFK